MTFGKIVSPFVVILFLCVITLGPIPIARAKTSSNTAHACVAPTSCTKNVKICYGPVAVKKPTVATFAAIQKSYVPAGFDTSTTLNPDTILTMINTNRAQAGRPLLEKNDALCAVAASRASEIPQEVTSGRFHRGLYARNLPYWITENMKYGSTESGTVAWWMRSAIHRRAILSDAKYSCGYCVGNACIQLFTSFVPKHRS